MSNIAERLKHILVEQGIKPVEIEETSRLEDDLGLDSLDVVEVVMAAEEEFEIEITDEEAEKLTTFGDAVKLVDSKLQKSA